MSFRTILRRPIVTEKSTLLREANRYVLEVDPGASKTEIRKEVAARFKVDVLTVRTMKVLGKFRRKAGPVGGYQSNWKKAIVTVKAGQQIKWEEAS